VPRWTSSATHRVLPVGHPFSRLQATTVQQMEATPPAIKEQAPPTNDVAEAPRTNVEEVPPANIEEAPQMEATPPAMKEAVPPTNDVEEAQQTNVEDVPPANIEEASQTCVEKADLVAAPPVKCEADFVAAPPVMCDADLVAAPPVICEELDVTIRLPMYSLTQNHEAAAFETAAESENLAVGDVIATAEHGTCSTVPEEAVAEVNLVTNAEPPEVKSPMNDEFAGTLSAKLQVVAVDIDKKQLAEAELQAFEEQRRAWDFVGAEALRGFAGDDSAATTRQKEDATALVLMGFQAGHAYEAVRKTSNLEEAANILLEKQSPSPSVWQSIVNWFGLGGDSSNFKPGKYRIHDSGATTVPAEGGSFEDTVHGIGAQGAQATRLEIGQTLDVVEIRKSGDEVRGRLVNGNWMCISSGDRIYARRVSLSVQLRELGYSEAQARDAEMRCSTIWAAVDFLSKKQMR